MLHKSKQRAEKKLKKYKKRLIRCVYDNNEAAILVEGEITDWFRIEIGAAQGCVWSPLLFGIMIDVVLRKSCDRQEYV